MSDVALNSSRFFVSAFLAILFVQSSFDKLFNWRGNLEWLKGHFSKTPLASVTPIMLAVLTLIELIAGCVSLAGSILIVWSHDPQVAFIGALWSAIAILCLFFGQRMAKEYAGAAVLVPYFLVTLVAIYLLKG